LRFPLAADAAISFSQRLAARAREGYVDVANYDLIIVGGGIGGSALATVMAKAGKSVLLLEQSETFVDRVRGEWIAPWGVAEVKRVGLYDLLMGAGGHHLARHVTYHESIPPEQSEAKPIPLSAFVEGVPGPLCIGHPHHCQTLFDAAKAAGADARREVGVTEVTFSPTPSVTFEDKTGKQTATARLVIGADGRTSTVRDAAGIELHQDKPHHWFAGLLIEGVDSETWEQDLEAVGTEGDFHFLAFPQGEGRVRIYGGYALDQAQRFKGPEGPRRFLDAFAFDSSPRNRALVNATPAGPLMSYINADAWTDEPYAEGVVLVGDAAGWNDPLLGLGLSITYRDVRMVSEILQASDDWSAAVFKPYGDERRERLRRLRFLGNIQSRIEVEFGPEAEARRKSYLQRSASDPFLRAGGLAVLGGPERAPAEYFTPEGYARVLDLADADQ
jgi:2-polyprenyl-6-methoxyphenol hydroxylase-like FAD-dependent oxidoreductase